MWSTLIERIEADVDIKHKLSFLNTFINVHGISLENEDDVILVKSKIKILCTDSTQRTGGLLLLYAVVQASSSIYIDNWSQLVLGSLKVADYVISREIPLRVLNKMLINFSHYPEYSVVFSKLIPDILPIILDPEDDRIYKLSCQTLAVCMKCVPKITGTRVVDIENLLLRELNNPYGEIIEAIGECFAVLPMCIFHLQRDRRQVIKYSDVWGNLFTKILSTLDLVFNQIMQLTEDHHLYVDVSSQPVFAIPSLEASDDIPPRIDIFKSLCLCLAKMMSSESPDVVTLDAKRVLDTLKKVFEIEKIIESQGPIIEYLKLGYSQILNGAYVVLEALILSSKLEGQSKNFLDLMKKSLNVMNETSFSESTVSQVRGSTWKLIDVWMKQQGPAGSSLFAKVEDLKAEITSDIEVAEKDISNAKQLKASVYGKNEKNNKIYVCIHALKVLKSFIETDGGYITKKFLDEISGTLLRISKVVAINSVKRHFPMPYSHEKCRKHLFDVLLSYALFGDPLPGRCIVEAQNIFHLIRNDPSTKVSRICHRFRKLSRYYLNPRKPPPDAVQYSNPSLLNEKPLCAIASVKDAWANGMDWSPTDDQMDDNEVGLHDGGNFSNRLESEEDLMAIEHNEGNLNHNYRRIAKQSSLSTGGEDSHDDSDEEPTYVSTDSNPQRIVNDSSHINSFGMQSSVEQYANGIRTDRCASGETVPMRNNAQNSIDEHVSSFVEVKSGAQKPPQNPMGNGVWKREEHFVDSSDEESEMEEEECETREEADEEECEAREEADEEECEAREEADEEECEAREEADEEGDVNEEVSDNAADEDSDGRHSPDFDDERPTKRQKCNEFEDKLIDEVVEQADEDVDSEDIPANNQSSGEERQVNNFSAVEQNAENPNKEENQIDSEDVEKKGVDAMCGDFVLAEAKELATPTTEAS